MASSSLDCIPSALHMFAMILKYLVLVAQSFRRLILEALDALHNNSKTLKSFCQTKTTKNLANGRMAMFMQLYPNLLFP